MDFTRDNLLVLIRDGLKSDNLSISGLEKTAGVPKDTVRDFLRGKTQILRADKLQKILGILSPSTLPLSGIVGKDAEIFALSENDPQRINVACPAGYSSPDIVAIRVDSNAMEPVFYKGWTLYYTTQNSDFILSAPKEGSKTHVPHAPSAQHDDPLASFYNKPCVVQLKDGRTFLRTLKATSKKNHYDLIGYNTADIRNTEVAWAARIVFIATV